MNFCYIVPNPLTLALSPIWGEGWGEGYRTGDEPTSALDPEMINEVLEVMTDLAQEGLR
jgi:ABC-type hemin transport system ATPase subunit